MLKKSSEMIQRISDIKIGKRAMYAVFFLYLILISVISFYHEPWYDEAQAWQIARCASVYDIIFTTPHFEGHPPFWHLILMPFAKSGMPYEFSLSFINIAFIGIAVWLMMFLTSLPSVMKVTLPFTYFLCYQYAVISRPYSIMALGFILCALNYNRKNEHPMKMVLSLMILCASSAYGLAYAFFICIAWILELWNKKNVFSFIREFIKSSAFKCLCLLLIFAVFLLMLVIPSEESLIKNASKTYNAEYYLGAFLYTFLLLPYDATIGSIMISDINVFMTDLLKPEYIPYCIVSVGIYAVIVFFAVKQKKGCLLIPVIFMPIVFGLVFFFSHHMGIFILYLLFLTCVCFDESSVQDENAVMAKNIYSVFIYAMIVTQIAWSVLSCVNEVGNSYVSGRYIAEYIKNNGITDTYIMPAGTQQKNEYNFDVSVSAVITLPYFDHNIYPSFNSGNDNEGYVLNLYCTNEENAEKLEHIKEAGPPEYMIGVIDTDTLEFGLKKSDDDHNEKMRDDYFDFIYDNADYEIAVDFEYGGIFKGHYKKTYEVLFERVDNNE